MAGMKATAARAARAAKAPASVTKRRVGKVPGVVAQVVGAAANDALTRTAVARVPVRGKEKRLSTCILHLYLRRGGRLHLTGSPRHASASTSLLAQSVSNAALQNQRDRLMEIIV